MRRPSDPIQPEVDHLLLKMRFKTKYPSRFTRLFATINAIAKITGFSKHLLQQFFLVRLGCLIKEFKTKGRTNSMTF